MIGELKYSEVEAICKELKDQIAILNQLLKIRNIQELNDFVATVEGYSKYLETTLEMNKDADKALEFLLKNKA